MYVYTYIILIIIYILLLPFGKTFGKIANKDNALVIGQITCWLVFIFSKFIKWKNGKIGT